MRDKESSRPLGTKGFGPFGRLESGQKKNWEKWESKTI